MKAFRSIGLAVAVASVTFGAASLGVPLATPAAHAASVDVSKDGWWLNPYKASKQWTIGVSYTDTSISYIAALQRAVQAKAKEMGVKIIEVDANRDDDDEAERRLLNRRGHVEHHEAALNDLHDQGADEGGADAAAAAEQTGPAHYHGGDGN